MSKKIMIFIYIYHILIFQVVRYGGGDGNAPRSLSRSGNSQYYYG